MDTRVDKLISAIGKLRDFNYTREDVIAVKNILDLMFNPDAKCKNFIYTVNTDKLPFGCVVFPVFEPNQVYNFMIVGESTIVKEYEVELDSKMFDYGLTDEQIVQMILFNVYHMIKDTKPAEKVREIIDLFFTKNTNNLVIRNSVQYQAILSLGLADALSQITSCLNLPDDVLYDPFLDSVGLDDFKGMLDKAYRRIPGCNAEVTRMPKLTMLEWCLRLYDDVEKERIPALHLLNKVKSLTASALYISKFNAAISTLNRIDNDEYVSEAVEMVFNEAKRHGGLLASLKYNGLRDIENDLYEFQVRAKNAETENDVMYALKQINARLAILDDYIRENSNDPEIDRWIAVKMEYMDIRDILAKKNLHKRSYGVFVDYNALDKLDNDPE